MINLNKIPQTGFENIDSEHKHLADLFNNLYTLVYRNNEDEGISVALSKVISYIRTHFLHEEKFMNELSYPYALEHKAEHTKILNEIQLAIINWREEKDYKKFRDIMEIKIPTWFMQHIVEMDMKLVKYSKVQKD